MVNSQKSALITGSTTGSGQSIATAVAKAGYNVMLNGFGDSGEIENFPAEKWDAILAINLSACFHTIQQLVPAMKKKGRGRIINIASAHALVASPYNSSYIAAKHGVLGLTKTVALEVAESGLTGNAICPGYVRTPLVEGQIEDTAKARGIDREAVIRDVLLAVQPTKQFVKSGDLAALVLFLVGDHSAAFNAAALPIDGGWIAQ